MKRADLLACADGREIPPEAYPKGWSDFTGMPPLVYEWIGAKRPRWEQRNPEVMYPAYKSERLVEVYRAPGVEGIPSCHVKGVVFTVDGRKLVAYGRESLYGPIPF